MSYLSIQKDDLFEKIKKRNQELNHYGYGFIYNGKKETENFDYYKTISPIDFEKHKMGVCWDYVEVEARDLWSYGFNCTIKPLEKDKEFSLYYIIHTTKDGINPTHTWLGFRYNNSIYSFESSWGKYQGIHKFTSEKAMLNTYQRWHKEDIKSDIDNCYIFKFKPRTKFGKTPMQYMNSIHSTGKCYFSTNTNHQKLDYHL